MGNLAPLRAIFPRHDAPVVRVGQGGGRELVSMHWGFVLPQVSKRMDAPIQPKAVNNARDDKLRASSFWRESLIARRCLLPGTSFSEAQGRSPAVIHWFGVLDEEGGAPAPFAFAAIWRRWRGLYRDEPREMDRANA